MDFNKKADILYLTFGTNPFPNIVSVVTRIKENGKIICICSKEIEEMYKKFKYIMEEKVKGIKIESIELTNNNRNYYCADNVRKKVVESLVNLNNFYEELTVELNYTGSTKLISAISYDTFKTFSESNIKMNFVLSYIDSEREKYVYEIKKTGEKKYKSGSTLLKDIKTDIELKIEDIAKMHIREIDIKPRGNTNLINEKLSKELFSMFLDNDHRITKKRLALKNDIYTKAKECNNSEKINEFKEMINEKITNKELLLTYRNTDEFGFKCDKDLVEYFNKSKWSEEYIFSILQELKEEEIISDAVINFERYKIINRDEKEDEKDGNVIFEVDVIAYRPYKIFVISITTSNKEIHARQKLFQVKHRANDISGCESGTLLINFCESNNKLQKETKNIWDKKIETKNNSNKKIELKNMKMLGMKDLSNLKKELSQFFTGGSEDEK